VALYNGISDPQNVRPICISEGSAAESDFESDCASTLDAVYGISAV
jgi:hypothetical protein